MDSSLKRNLPNSIQIPVLGFIMLISIFLSSLLSILLESNFGFSISSSDVESLVENRGSLRIMLLIGNAFMFLVPALVFSIFLFRKEWLKSVNAHLFPSLKSILLGLFIMVAAIGIVAYSYYLNGLFPIPDWMLEAEERNQKLLTAALTMDSVGELMVCIFIVALVPALGEELIFRGILQDRLYKWSKNEHLSVWLIAIVFSAIHMQFQGFIPRMLLGAILGYMFVWSGSLWLPIIAHFFNNAFQVVVYYYQTKVLKGRTVDISELPEVYWWQALISFVIVVGLMMLLRNVGKSVHST